MINVDPEDAAARGLQLLQSSRFAEARDLLSAHCRARPDSSHGWFLLGAASHALGDLEQALTALRTACDLSPQFVQALSALAAVELARGEAVAALVHYRRALELEPLSAQLWTNLGVAHGMSGDWQAALQSYDTALECDAGFPAALMNRGGALSRLGRLEEALANNDRFAEAYADSADAHYNRAEVLLALLRFDEAIAACERACAMDPRHAAAHFDRALALTCLGRLDEADAAFETSRAYDPHRFASRCASSGLTLSGESRLDTRALYLLRLLARNDACDWRRRDELGAQFEIPMQAAVGSARPMEMPELAFSSLSMPLRRDTRIALARSVAAGFARRAEGGHPHRGVQAAHDRIRIGYVSPDLRLHAVGLLLQDLFRLHDRSRFEIFAYSLAPDDRSAVRERIASGVDRLRDVADLSDDAIARRIADDGIDVLVDLAGYTLGSRSGVFARRPAQVQVNYLGYAGSLGAEYIDYAIVDAVLCPPESDRDFTEKLVRLPTTFSPAGAELPSHPGRDRIAAGLPDAGFVFCCFTSNFKIDPGIFASWMEILARVPASCLWLARSHGQTQQNLSREAEARGIDPHRLIFAPLETYSAYIARYDLADLFLDTRWFNAHTTAIDALRRGVPVLTLAGEAMCSRLGASVLRAAGLPELIAYSLDEYKSRAIELANDRAAFAALRCKLQRTLPGSALMDLQGRTRELEAAYLEMVKRQRAGLAPEAFHVKAIPQRLAWF